jgi:hypothetical protein
MTVQGSPSFLKKRSKKLLETWLRRIGKGRSQNEHKFFGSFFQKRTSLLSGVRQ